jgi:integrase
MPAKRKYEVVIGEHFAWHVYRRGEVYQADGRSNKLPAGRHSLGTKSYEEALENLRHLDRIKAVELGLADASILNDGDDEMVTLEQGVELYLQHVSRPRVAGGAKPATRKRYKAVFDKFLAFLKQKGIYHWNLVRVPVLEQYAAWLDGEGYAYRTEFLELTTIKQAINWMITATLLPVGCRIEMPLTKPTGTDTYCWRREEIEAIIRWCRSQPKLDWLGDVLTALACTGMRISELASLRWTDIDLDNKMIRLTDESTSRVRRRDGKRREIKNRRSRALAVHGDLMAVLERLDKTPGGLIFRGPKGGVLSPDIVRRTLIRDVLAGLADEFPAPEGEVGFTHGRLHSFRHYFCSMCANNNVPEQLVMEWLGHQESKMVRHYYHAHNEEAQRQMKKLNLIGRSDATEGSD